ncbi:uncharacterized protein BDZ99DRAFT_463134 [Mytilinidion resinicola]|uniref:EamA domain-containing protein n=1 Tax=Mytilinidion resinicola TaxID=574789 RepID=A0A6A6YK75_9PEZI|nr:uncharacterized protein BDZ99DRAFT_463134 [Mytilinidion resinicola]KAF2809276.1 hypothetical protein BDZ99DRAFT_463134 [Mytilinidion resinicola]
MSLPPPPRAPVEDDKSLLSDIDDVELDSTFVPGKPAAKSEQGQLSVPFAGGIRAPSPDTLSNISIDDFNNIRIGRNPDYLPVPGERRHASRSPAPPPRTLKEKAALFWTRNKGMALVMISQVFGTLMNVTTRLLEIEGNHGKGMHPFQILFARMSITVVLASGYMWYTKAEHFPLGLKEVRPLLVARGLGGFFGVFGMYYSLLYLPLADATVITFLAPSLACWACSYLINEPFTRMEQIAAYVSLFGVVLIARPTSLFSSSSSTPPASGDGDIAPIANLNSTVDPTRDHFASNYDFVTPGQRAGAVGVAMLGVLGATCAFTSLRWIGRRAHPLLSVNYFAAWTTIVSTVMMFALPSVGFLLPADFKEWCYLIFLGICGFLMQFMLAAGLQYEKSSRATNMVYTQMLFALAFDKLVWGTTPSPVSLAGSSLILGSAIYVAMMKDGTVHNDGTGRGIVRERGGGGDEEVGLMSPMIAGEVVGEGDMQLRPLRI